MINKITFYDYFEDEETNDLYTKIDKKISNKKKSKSINKVISILDNKYHVYCEYLLYSADLNELIEALGMHKDTCIKQMVSSATYSKWKDISNLFLDNLYYVCSTNRLKDKDLKEKKEMLYVYNVVYRLNHYLRKK